VIPYGLNPNETPISALTFSKLTIATPSFKTASLTKRKPLNSLLILYPLATPPAILLFGE